MHIHIHICIYIYTYYVCITHTVIIIMVLSSFYPMTQVATGGSGLFGLFGSKAAAPKTKSVEARPRGF